MAALSAMIRLMGHCPMATDRVRERWEGYKKEFDAA